MDRPDISVIITSYNISGYIRRAVASALAQTGVSVEVVIVDDLSTDDTWRVIESLDDPRIIRHRLPQNSGPSTARNTAIGLAHGRWLAVLDGDDVFESDRLSRCLRLAETEKADVVIDNLLVCRESDGDESPMFDDARLCALSPLSLAEFITDNQSFLGGYTLGYMKPLLSAHFLKSKELAYDPEIRIGEDYLLLAKALASGARCVIDPHLGYRYTVRAHSISHRLCRADVERIQLCDRKLLTQISLDPAAAHAQTKRERKLVEALAFTELVDALKRRSLRGTVQAALSCPRATLNLWRPIEARLSRLLSGQHG